jgi:hypothetical protein
MGILPHAVLYPSTGGAGIYACGQAVEEIGFSR